MERKSVDKVEAIDILTPKIKRVLQQTNKNNREDLEQELLLLILELLENKKNFNCIPTFFELLEKEIDDEQVRDFPSTQRILNSEKPR